jgi:hypothetical protein
LNPLNHLNQPNLLNPLNHLNPLNLPSFINLHHV